jgi:DNA primase
MKTVYNVEQVLGRLGVDAKHKGKEWWLRCLNPDHEDKNPSFRVRDEPGSPKHGCFNCLSCKFGGSLEDLVAHVLGFQGGDWDRFLAAKKWLAGSAVEQKIPNVEVQISGAVRRFRLPSEAIFEPLEFWVTPARAFALGRGIEPWQVERWGLGYIVDGPLAGRLLIPYRTPQKEPRGYTARTFVQVGKVAKRYKEPAPHEQPDFNAMLGEEHWREPGWHNVAAVSGSYFRNAHAVKLSTFETVVVLSDPDAAGDRLAAEMEEKFARHCKVVRVRLPEKTDANDYDRPAAKDKPADYSLAQRLEDAMGYVPYPGISQNVVYVTEGALNAFAVERAVFRATMTRAPSNPVG